MYPNTPIVGLWPDDVQREDSRVIWAGADGLLQESRIESALVWMNRGSETDAQFDEKPSATV